MNKEKNSGVIVMDASLEKIEKIKKRWKVVKNIGSILSKISTGGFIVSCLSPFDFEGPVVEIVTAVVAGVGFTLKCVAESKLGEFETKNQLDQTEQDALETVSQNISAAVSKGRGR